VEGRSQSKLACCCSPIAATTCYATTFAVSVATGILRRFSDLARRRATKTLRTARVQTSIKSASVASVSCSCKLPLIARAREDDKLFAHRWLPEPRLGNVILVSRANPDPSLASNLIPVTGFHFSAVNLPVAGSSPVQGARRVFES